MKKYTEHLLVLSLALFLHLGFRSGNLSDVVVVEATPKTWQLSTDQLSGDTLISLDYDPFFKSPKTFKAYPLKENLQRQLTSENQDNLVLIFHCTDGYRPHMLLSQVLSSNGYLAYEDTNAPEGKAWADSLTSRFPPFYLVWPNAEKGDKSFARPYGLERIEFRSYEEEFEVALPPKEALTEGFKLFSSTCMRCHSLNKVGGNMAPEFNYPKNITEYWNKEDIWGFIQDPKSYRFNSKMPPMSIDREQFEKIYAYLKGMKDHKGE